MSELSMIFVLVISLIILIIGLVYLSMSSTQIKSIAGYDKDKNLAQAEKYNLWAVIIGWLCVIGLFFAGLGLLFGGEEILLATGGGGGLLTGTLVIVVILIIMVGVLSALSASEISKSVQYKTGKQEDKTGAVPAYNDAVIAASSCLGTFLFVVVALIIYQIGKSSGSSTETPLAEEEFRRRNYAPRRPVRRAPPLPPRRQQVRRAPPPLPPRPRPQVREEVRSPPPPRREEVRSSPSPPLPHPEPVVTKTRKEEQVIRKPRSPTTRRSVPYRRRYSTST